MIDIIASVWQTATPLILAALGGVLASRTGIWHLGLGGLMSIGAMVAVVIAKETGSFPLAIVGAIVSSTVVSLLMWFAVSKLRANAIIVGIGIYSLGLGGTVLGVVAIYGAEGTVYSPVAVPKVFEHAEGALSQLSVIAVATPLIVAAVWILCCRSRLGLRMSATGDHPFAAKSAGISISRMRLYALLLCGILCALAGAELALGSLKAFSPGMEAGRGLIAFAAVILGTAHPVGAAVAALFFGAVTFFGIWAQLNLSGVVPVEFMLMLPYVVTVAAVVITASVRGDSKKSTSFELRDI